MTPEELAECRAARDRFFAGNSSQVLLADILSALLEHIDEQAAEIKRLEVAAGDLRELAYKQRLALKKLGSQYHILRDMLRDPDIDYRIAQNPEYVSERLKGGIR